MLPALFTNFASLRFARFSLVLTFSGFRGLSTGSTILTLSTLAVNFMMFLARPNVDHLFCIEIVETARKSINNRGFEKNPTQLSGAREKDKSRLIFLRPLRCRSRALSLLPRTRNTLLD